MSIVLDGTNGITAANVYGRNLIINGSGRINQRGYTSGTATSGANEYTLDRWRVVTSGQSLTFTGTDAARVMTAPAGGAEQVIEGANIAGGTYVLNWTGTATATVDGNAVAKGGTFTLTANTNATVRFTGGTFSEVQVEAGSVATPFEHRPYGQELELCQRYYQKTYNDGVAPGTSTTAAMSQWRNVAASGGLYLRNTEFLTTRMRATPTYTIYNGSGTSGVIDSFDGTYRTHPVSAVDKTSARGFGGINVHTTSVPDNAEYYYHYTADAEL
jgi:hypothetical protein